MKKTLSIILSLAILLTFTSTPAFAYNLKSVPDDQESYTYIFRQDGSTGTATVAEINALIYERNLAILSGDTEKEAELQQAMYDAGVYPSTEEELNLFSGNKDATPQEKGTSSVSYDTTYYSISGYDGNVYEIKQITTHPTTSSNLFHSASVNNKTISSSVASGLYQLCKATGSYVFVKNNAYITAFSALCSVIAGFTSSTVVYGITANYACAALEQVSFYQYNVSGNWTPFASSSYVQTGFSGTIFSASYAGGSQQGLTMSVSQQQDTLYSTYSLNSAHTGYVTADMLDIFLSTSTFNKRSQVSSVSFYHNANGTYKYVKTLGMLCPTTLSAIY